VSVKADAKIGVDINYPNSCNLKQGVWDLTIRKRLADAGLEPREGSEDEEVFKGTG
jgi:hypothetical protein